MFLLIVSFWNISSVTRSQVLLLKKQQNGGCAVRHMFDNGSFMMRAGFERLAICSHEHFGFVILENLTWKMIFAELHFSSNVFFLLTFCRNPSGRFIWDMLYVALRLAGSFFIDSFTPTNHSCHPRNALYSSLPLGSAIFNSSVTEAAVY